MTPDRDLDADDRVRVALDFDGTIAYYDQWDGPAAIGHLLPGAEGTLRALAELDPVDVTIYSSRPPGPIRDWLRDRDLFRFVDEIDGRKRVYDILFDDRARRVEQNRPHDLARKVAQWDAARRRASVPSASSSSPGVGH